MALARHWPGTGPALKGMTPTFNAAQHVCRRLQCKSDVIFQPCPMAKHPSQTGMRPMLRGLLHGV